MPRPSARTAAAFVVLACAGSGGLAVGNDVVPAAAAGRPADGAPPKYVVLRSGKLIGGRLRQVANGYEVEGRAGVTFMPVTQVWFTAESPPQAYDELRRRMPDKTASGRVALARWCLTHQMPDFAREELRAALELEPDHAEARATVRMLEQVLDPDGTSEAVPSSLADRLAAVPAKPPTLGDLPPDLARAFTTTVQPILVNRCGNAACHGGAGDGFRLEIARVGSSGFRTATVRNLDAVRDRLDGARPEASPLLTAPKTPGHGRSPRPLFAGTVGDAQFRTLAEWVRDAAPKLAGTVPAAVSDDSPLVLTAAESPIPTPAAAPEEPTPAAPAATVAPSTDPTDDLLRRVLAEERPDAFDPEEFNRRFGPRAGRDPLPNEGPPR